VSGAVAAIDVVAAQHGSGELLGREVDLVGRLATAEDPERLRAVGGARGSQSRDGPVESLVFGAIGPQFRLLFGNAIEQAAPAAPDVRQLFGYGVHHTVRARICVERQRHWHAEYWISGVRDYALTMACVRLGLPAHFGRGFDGLPDAIRTAAASALVRSIERRDLLNALRCATDLLLSEAAAASVSTPDLVRELQDLMAGD